jgi:hypothetical protein
LSCVSSDAFQTWLRNTAYIVFVLVLDLFSAQHRQLYFFEYEDEHDDEDH